MKHLSRMRQRALGIAVGVTMSFPVLAQEITLTEITDKAIASSLELQIAEKDVAISRTEIKITRSEYFPTIQPRLNLEYLKDLENNSRPVVAVGNTIIPTGTRFQNSIGVSVNQTLLDFGSRKRKMIYAKEGVVSASSAYNQQVRDLKIKLIELYAEALFHYRALRANQAILDLAQQGYQLKKRLYAAGSHSRVDVATEAIQVAQALDEVQNQKQQLTQSLNDLSYFTHESYDVDSTELADFESHPLPDGFQFHTGQAPEARAADAQIAMKQQEIEILKRKYLPQVSLYSYYNLYGFDPDHPSGAIQDLSQRTISLGLSVELPSFDGFKTQAQIKKATLEKEKLVLQKEKTLAELQHRADTFQQELATQTVLLETKATIVNKTQDKLSLETRLSEQQLVDKTQAISDHIERIRRQLAAEQSLIQQSASQLKLTIMETGA